MTSTAGATNPQTPRRAKPRPPPAWRSWLVWSAPALFYLIAYFVRVSPAVMTRELMGAFGISAGSLGSLSATYFYAYVAMQIPTGILVDSWGARKLLLVGTLSTAVGSLLFGWTGNFALACVARALIGGATAVAWVTTLKLITHWFPARRFAMLSGLSLFIGNLGALVAQIPLRLLVQDFGWRPVTVASGGVVALIAVLAFFLVRNDPSHEGYESYAPASLRTTAPRSLAAILRGLGNLFRYRNTWLIFWAQGGLLGPVLAFTGLWGPAYLAARYGLSATAAAGVDSVMLVCFAVASPLMGHFSDVIGRRKPLYVGGAAVAAVGWAVMVFVPRLPLHAFVAVAGVTSFAAAAIILGFAMGKESVPEQYLGTISGLINMSNMLGPMLLQPAIGWMLDRHWAGQTLRGLRLYSAPAFHDAFILMVVWSLAAFVLLALTRETHCRPAV